ncbi:MAG TPA: hypothetical protein PLH97_11395 [Verrucomicrobiota bacterium]|nr:hypothetical protein [Verrucomicrobiota bacterium]HPU56864.1 hypothetical protein [Verrucomicrobiota bacterium]
MKKYRFCGAILAIFVSFSSSAQTGDRVELGSLASGATVSFVRDAGGKWGVEINGGKDPRILQPKPAQVEVFRTEEDIRTLATGYDVVEKSGAVVEARAEVSAGDSVVFRVKDRWSLSGAVLSVARTVDVTGNASGGFNSSVVLTLDRSINWTDVNCFAPGALYGDPTFNGDRSPGGTANYAARHFLMREDILSAPLFALSFSNGASVSMLNPSPRGDSTVAETRLVSPVMVDARFQFGALGAWQTDDRPIELGFYWPGPMRSTGGGPRGGAAGTRWMRRYHPITQGVTHSYEVRFRFGQNESFRDLIRNSWRWAWNTLNPAVTYVDVEQVRRTLIDQLASVVLTTNGRTAMPFVIATFPTNAVQWNYTMTAMGFVGKSIESADQLLREADRDPTERGRMMREKGLAIISSLIKALSTVPLQGTGYDVATGERWTGDHPEWVAPWLRNATEDMRVLMRAYRREKALGREHPEWLNWVKSFVDWLVLQQRPDGSFPRCWEPGSSEVADASGTSSYNPVPLLVLMSEITGSPGYRESAERAAEYVWSNWGSRGLYVGGTIDNPNITDKEAGMLSLEAFLSLYESTKESKWLERARAAADFTETWIWIWNVPMPLDADDAQLHWKKGVPTVGVQGISARGPGGVDQYLAWSVSSYAKLSNYSRDEHYLDVARILLHNTKAMLALPGRLYDLKGAGWQQEHWRLGPGGGGRGVGGHRFWLPWVTVNHLYGITGLEEYDPALFKTLSSRPGSSAGSTPVPPPNGSM